MHQRIPSAFSRRSPSSGHFSMKDSIVQSCCLQKTNFKCTGCFRLGFWDLAMSKLEVPMNWVPIWLTPSLLLFTAAQCCVCNAICWTMRARTSNRDNELVQFFLREQEGEIPLQNTSEMKQKRFTKVTESYLKTETSTFFFFAQWQPFTVK